VHIADNGDGTFTNPVMQNAHWSDPSVVRVGNTYYVVTSSIETTPSLQILRSTDLVNYDVVGSVSRHWFTHTVDGVPLLKRQCWSPRLMFVAGKFRVMWHQSGQFMVAESVEPQGPWSLVHHNLTGMAQPTPQWAATTYLDTDGKTYVFAFNWIRETDAAALNWIGPQHPVADMHAVGVGLMENPSLMKRGEYYYWHESVNGTVTWGLAPDPNAGPQSSNKGARTHTTPPSLLHPLAPSSNPSPPPPSPHPLLHPFTPIPPLPPPSPHLLHPLTPSSTPSPKRRARSLAK
jgi:beta-xylosidase